MFPIGAFMSEPVSFSCPHWLTGILLASGFTWLANRITGDKGINKAVVPGPDGCNPVALHS